nr:MAG TPA: holin [Caudoviricetes sp.]
MRYIIPDKAYNVLKWVGLVALPAIATFVGTVGTACEWEFTGIAVTVITAIGTLVGSLIGVSHVTAKDDAND